MNYKILKTGKVNIYFYKPTPAPPDVKSGQALQGGELWNSFSCFQYFIHNQHINLKQLHFKL